MNNQDINIENIELSDKIEDDNKMIEYLLSFLSDEVKKNISNKIELGYVEWEAGN